MECALSSLSSAILYERILIVIPFIYYTMLHTYLFIVGLKEKDHLCHTCGKAFATKEYVTIHFNAVHNEELKNKWKCALCSYATSIKSCLNRHIKRVHKSS